jgi:hypothetical protein
MSHCSTNPDLLLHPSPYNPFGFSGEFEMRFFLPPYFLFLFKVLFREFSSLPE